MKENGGVEILGLVAPKMAWFIRYLDIIWAYDPTSQRISSGTVLYLLPLPPQDLE